MFYKRIVCLLALLHQPLIRNHKRERKTPTRFTELPSKKRKYVSDCIEFLKVKKS